MVNRLRLFMSPRPPGSPARRSWSAPPSLGLRHGYECPPANGFEPTAAILQQVFESGSRPWQDPDMTLVLSGRAETSTQSRILSYVRDDGPLSRMDLAARLNVSR